MLSKPKPYEVNHIYFRLLANVPQPIDQAERAALFNLAVAKVQQAKMQRAERYRRKAPLE